jgi:DNA helicase-2/ATP-dependent DNA helicase PcrA
MELQNEDPILDGLNERQLEAVTLQNRSALILAGAGSGKTGVLTRRIAYLIQKGIPETDILAVTFTNKAAGEMRRRIRRLVPDIDPKQMWVGTFHGTCYRMITANPEAAGARPGVVIIDEEDKKSIIRRVMGELNIPVAGSKLAKEMGVEGLSVSKVCGMISGWKERGLSAKSMKPDSTGEIDRIFEMYEEVLIKENLLDFADLMNKAVFMLENSPEVRKMYQEKFQHILVDEFQDTSDQQFKWLSLLRSPRAHVMAVGDDDQSIYGFRNARPENMQDFLNEIPNCGLIKLEKNYRSTQQVLNLANAIINKNTERMGKELWSDKSDGALPMVKRYRSDMDEADAIVQDIQQRIANGQRPNSIAVIYRTNAQSRLLESRMVRRNVPHRVYGGFRFFERQEIKQAIAYMQFLHNPDNETALLRIINVPTRKLGEKTVEELRARAAQHGRSLFSQMLAEASDEKKPVKDFVDLFMKLDALRDSSSLVNFVKAVTHETGLYGMYENLPDPKEAEERTENLRDLANAALEFQNEHSTVGADDLLQDFLAGATLETSTTPEADGAQKAPRNSVSLMTVHTAKGLEFDTVYLAGLEDGLFPHAAAVGREESEMRENPELEEERRLLYVAVTRAKSDLIVSYATRRAINGQVAVTGESYFILNDISSRLVQFQNFATDVPFRKKAGKVEQNNPAQAQQAAAQAPRRFIR